MPNANERLADAIQRAEHLAEQLLTEAKRMKQIYREQHPEIARDVFSVQDDTPEEGGS